MLADRSGQLGQLFGIEAGARLARVGADGFHRNWLTPPAGRLAARDQRIQAAPSPAFRLMIAAPGRRRAGQRSRRHIFDGKAIACQHFLGQGGIGHAPRWTPGHRPRSAGHRRALRPGARCAAPWLSKDLFAKIAAHFFDHIVGQVGAPVVHRQHHAAHSQLREERPAHPLDGVGELAQAFQRQILALHRDDHAIPARHQPVEASAGPARAGSRSGYNRSAR